MNKSTYARRLAQGLAAGLSFVAAQAYAALPAGIQGAIDTATADGTELGYSLLGMAVVVGVIFWLKRKA